MVMGNLPMIIMPKKSDSFTSKAGFLADVSKSGNATYRFGSQDETERFCF